MSEITPFQFPATGHMVRVVTVNGEPWFVAVDVCATLGIGNPSQAVSYLDEDERDATLISNEGDPYQQQRSVNIVSEPGLYSLILRSRKPSAKAFKRWITHEVLPQIRRTGSYSPLPELPQTHAEALRALADEVEAHEQTRQRAAALEAPAQAWNVLADATGDYSVREAAQILDRDPAISTGQNRLFVSLRELGWIDRKGIPYQGQVDVGRIVQRPTSYTHPHKGEPILSSQIRITAKGVEALRRLLGGGDDGYLFALPDGA